MSFEAFFELVGFAAILLALRYYFQGRLLAAIPASRLALGILLFASMMKYLVNGAEWSGMVTAFAGLDPLEDYLDDIWPLLWFFLFFSILMDFAGKETRESRKRYQMLFDGSKDAICIMDGKAAILECNESTAALTGHDRKALVRMSMKDIDTDFDPEIYQSRFNRPVNSVSFIKETVIRRKDGTRIPVELSNRLVMIHHQKVMHTVVRDISDRKQAQQLLESEK
jgi:PAS domain S-box-containing protein